MRYKTKKAIKKWLATNDYKDIKVYNNNEFEFNYLDNAIGIADTMCEIYVDDFEKLVVNELNLSQDTLIPTLYFLHELGHYNTENEFSQFDEYKYLFINKILDLLLLTKNEKLAKKINKIYQHLPQEKRATSWAVEFIRENPSQAKQLDKIFESNAWLI